MAAPVTVGLVSLGCAKNMVDLQVMGGTLLRDGLELAPNPDEADVILVNTCAFILDARKEADAEIRRACSLKRAGKAKFVVASGCLPQRYGQELVAKYPDVDGWIGIDHIHEITDVILGLFARRDASAAKPAAPEVRVSKDRNTLYEPPLPELALTGGVHAFLKIAEGCNHACAYCAIPGIRGKLRSRYPKDILAEARALVRAGYRELDVVGQDVTAYGRDLRDGTSLATLLRSLDRMRGTFWIRLLYGYPSLLGADLLDAIAASRHVCRYIDVPIQHSHPDILRAMRRADTIRHVAGLPDRLRAAVPGIALRTTCLVGFPGETDEHFEHLLDYVKRARFDQLGVFCFSPEEGTAAFGMADAVPHAVAVRRRDRLLRAQRAIVDEKLAALEGTEAEALVCETHGDGTGVARTAFQAPDVDGRTLLSGLPAEIAPGEIVKVAFEGRDGYDLVGRFLG